MKTKTARRFVKRSSWKAAAEKQGMGNESPAWKRRYNRAAKLMAQSPRKPDREYAWRHLNLMTL